MNNDPLDSYLMELIGEAVALPADDLCLAETPHVMPTAPVDEITSGMEAPADALTVDDGPMPVMCDTQADNDDQAVDTAAPPVDPTAINLSLLEELDNDPLFAAAIMPAGINQDLLDELDNDPLFAAQPAAAAPAINQDLLDELDNDPLFAAPVVHPAPAINQDLLDELDNDPLFARPATDTLPAINQDLLDELDSDPLFAAPDQPLAAPPASSVIPPPAAQPLWQPTALQTPENKDRDGHFNRRATERTSRWLRLRCGEQPYALELLKVQEVGLLSPVLSLRGTPAHMLGIMNLRGQVVPVMDLGVFLGTEPAQESALTRIIVLESNGQALGLRVTTVEDVCSLTDSQIEPPDTTRLCQFSNQLFRGVARLGGAPMILLDAEALLN